MARTKVATKLYAAPEFFFFDTVGQDFDTWSLGVILYEIMTLCKPFKNEKRIRKIKYDHKLIGDKQIRNIVEHIFQSNAARRPLVKQIVKELVKILNQMGENISYNEIK